MRHSNTYEPRIAAISQSQLASLLATRSWMPAAVATRAVMDPTLWVRRVRYEQQRFMHLRQQ